MICTVKDERSDLIDGRLCGPDRWPSGGCSLDQVVKQLPSRRRIGPVAYSKYFMAADLANGRFWYGALGMAAYVLTLVSAVAGYIENVDLAAFALLLLAALMALVHAFGTVQAAPTAFQVRGANNDEALLNELFNKFSRWTAVRGIAGVMMFGAILLVLVEIG